MSNWDGLILTIAQERAQRFDHFDDAVQEARIKLWQAEQERGELTSKYAAGIIRNSVRNSVAHRLWTGHGRTQGKAVDPAESALQMPEHYDAPAPALLPELADSATERAVREVVAELPERERRYIIDRFWHGETRQQDGPMWARVIKPKLREALAHLQPV